MGLPEILTSKTLTDRSVQLMRRARERVLLFDGAMGTQIHSLELPDGAFGGSLDGISSQPAAGTFHCRPGGGTLRNLVQPGPVTLIFPPPEPGAYSMLIDGTGRVVDGGEDTAGVLEVSFGGGVLHRPVPVDPGDLARC